MFCNNLLVHVLAPDGVCIDTGLRCGLHAQSNARVRDDSFRQELNFLLAQPPASLDLTVVIAFPTLRSGGSTAAQSAQDIIVKSGVLRLQLSRQATAKLHHFVLHHLQLHAVPRCPSHIIAQAEVVQQVPADSSFESMAAGTERKYIMISGKGGVGKTSLAASLAVKFAAAGHTTLVVSTDPAHSLSDSLDQVFVFHVLTITNTHVIQHLACGSRPGL